MRDVLSGEVPQILRPGHLALTASVAGAILYALFNGVGVSQFVLCVDRDSLCHGSAACIPLLRMDNYGG